MSKSIATLVFRFSIENTFIDGFVKTRESGKITDFSGKGEATKQVTFLRSKNGASVVCADAQANVFASWYNKGENKDRQGMAVNNI